MIIVRLMGGLGNQLFQYALGRCLAARNQVPLKLDLSFYESQTLRSYRLDHFNIVASIASEEEVAHAAGVNRGWGYRVAQRLLPYHRRRVIRERQVFYFDSQVLQAGNKVYLVGYWQSERYFKEIAALLRQEIVIKNPPDPANRELLDHIKAVKSVSLHVRRADYVSNPLTQALHGICGLDYYNQAIAYISKRVSQPCFFVFSDEPDWTRQNIRLDHPVTHVVHNGLERDYEDLRLMRHCKHHVIANSSFSWWGAWLAAHPDKIVVAPQRWLNDPRYDTTDLIPETWRRL